MLFIPPPVITTQAELIWPLRALLHCPQGQFDSIE